MLGGIQSASARQATCISSFLESEWTLMPCGIHSASALQETCVSFSLRRRGEGKKAGGGGVRSRRRQNDVSDGRNAGSLRSGVVLPSASAKRSRFLPEVVDDCWYVGRRLSLRDRATIRDESVFPLNKSETGALVVLSQVKKWCTP